MRTSRAFALLLTLLLFVAAGCSSGAGGQEIGEPGTWKDGSYEQTVEGRNGKFTVTVLVVNGYIADIAVGDNSETPERGGVAIAEMPGEMVEAQSYDVDGVTGASITSGALRDAVKAVLTEASGN